MNMTRRVNTSKTRECVQDVAAYIVQKHGPVGPLKLQKLVYYAQAWSLVWDNQALFNNRIEAWTYGPVVPELWKQQANTPTISDIPGGRPDKLTASERETIEAVLAFYGDHDDMWLSELTHREDPWRLARGNLRPEESGSEPITHESLKAYYGAFGITSKSLPDSLAQGMDLLVSFPLEAVPKLFDRRTYDASNHEHWLLTGQGEPWANSEN
jgi:uncharacterized phage-associated protein